MIFTNVLIVGLTVPSWMEMEDGGNVDLTKMMLLLTVLMTVS